MIWCTRKIIHNRGFDAIVKQDHTVCVPSRSIQVRNCGCACCPETIQRREHCAISIVGSSTDSSSRRCIGEWASVSGTHRTRTTRTGTVSKCTLEMRPRETCWSATKILLKPNRVNFSCYAHNRGRTHTWKACCIMTGFLHAN